MAKIYGHRGAAAYAPENTMSSFITAHSMKADGIELDVQLTADHQVVVIHDEKLTRTTGAKGMVSDWTWDQLRQLDAGSFFAPRFRGEGIPTLVQVLDYLKTTDMQLNIEIKSSVLTYQPGLVELVNRQIVDSGLQSRILVSSFDHKCLMQLKFLNPALPIGLLYSTRLVHPGEYAKSLGAAAIHPFHGNLDREDVEECHRLGIKVNPWTVDTPQDMRRMLDLGVDTLITNCPDLARQL